MRIESYSRMEFCDKCKIYSTFVQSGVNTLSCKNCGNTISKYRIDYSFIVLAIVSASIYFSLELLLFGYFDFLIFIISCVVWVVIFILARILLNVF